MKAGLLLDLANGCFRCGFAELLRSARSRPKTVVSSLDHEHVAFVVAHHNRDRDDECVRLGGVGIVVVVTLTHAVCLSGQWTGLLPHGCKAVGIRSEQVSRT